MSNNKHTPGPWKMATTGEYVKGRDTKIVDGKVVTLIQIPVVCDVTAQPEQMANARLITQAPKMSKLLEEMINAPEIGHLQEEHYLRAQEIIKKVKGAQ